MNLWTYRAKLIRVIDGDTVRFSIDHGMRIYSEQNIRLLGVDTPELFSGTNREAGAAARDFTSNWLVTHTHDVEAIWPFTLITEKDKESFNRYVGSVVCAQGHSLAADLISAGYVIS